MKRKRKKRFERLLRKQTPEERKELTESIRENGCREPIVLMQGDVIVDGHHRDEICDELGIDPPVTIKTFDSEEEAERWIIRNQLARRNLSPRDFKLMIGRLYNNEKNDTHDNLKVGTESPKGHNGTSGNTAEKVANETGTSVRTVKRSGKLAEAYDSLPKPVQTVVENFPKACSDRAVVELAKLPEPEQKKAAKAVKSGDTLDEAVNAAKPKPAKGREVSPAKLVDELTRQHIGKLVRGIDAVATVNGGKGKWHKQANDSLNGLIGAMKKMREGHK